MQILLKELSSPKILASYCPKLQASLAALSAPFSPLPPATPQPISTVTPMSQSTPLPSLSPVPAGNIPPIPSFGTPQRQQLDTEFAVKTEPQVRFPPSCFIAVHAKEKERKKRTNE